MKTTKTAFYTIAQTEFGPMLVAGDGRKLVAIKFNVGPGQLQDAVDALERELKGGYVLVENASRVKPLVTQLTAYLRGKRTSFDVELDLTWMTPFRQKVLGECARVPRGQVTTYAELARRAGRPTAFRAVGHTMATNPVPIVVPCHRVLGSDGTLHGFGGGLDMKARLLALEGARLA